MNKADQIKSILELVNTDRASAKDLALFAARILKLIKEIQTSLSSDISTTSEECTDKLKEISTSLTESETALKKLISDAKKDSKEGFETIEKEIKKIYRAISDVPQFDAGEVKKEIADLYVLVEKLSKKVGDIKMPTPEETRDALETLEGEDRLDVSAIKGIEKLFKKLFSQIKTSNPIYTGGGGGSSGGGRIVREYDLSSQLDGVLKTFALPANWRVISVHASSTPNILRPTVDYTYTPSSITFTSEISESTTLAAGQTLIIIYSEP
jgi:hypothetical protein